MRSLVNKPSLQSDPNAALQLNPIYAKSVTQDARRRTHLRISSHLIRKSRKVNRHCLRHRLLRGNVDPLGVPSRAKLLHFSFVLKVHTHIQSELRASTRASGSFH